MNYNLVIEHLNNLILFLNCFFILCGLKFNVISFQGVVGLVTGGASGLGKATVERIVQQGGRVVLCDLPKSSGSQVAKDIGDNCLYAPVDVSISEADHF